MSHVCGRNENEKLFSCFAQDFSIYLFWVVTYWQNVNPWRILADFLCQFCAPSILASVTVTVSVSASWRMDASVSYRVWAIDREILCKTTKQYLVLPLHTVLTLSKLSY